MAYHAGILFPSINRRIENSPPLLMKHIPNIFTLLNLVFGCLALIFIFQTGIGFIYASDGSPVEYIIPEKIWLASLFVGLAAIVDFLDGLVARLFKAASEMGKELDSLADLVSFGVVPGMIVFQFLKLNFMQEKGGLDFSFVWLLPALLIPCAAAYRLARFNLDKSQSVGFTGIPTPAVGLLVASLPLIYWTSEFPVITTILLNKWGLYILILFVSYGMISHWPLLSFKFKDFSIRHNLPRYILIIVAMAAFALLRWLAVPLMFILYIVVSLAFKKSNP